MIKGFSEPKRLPRMGKIYLGLKQEHQSGKSYPVATDYFVVRADGVNTSEEAAKAFHEVYGETPKDITIAFPSDDPEVFMPQYLSAYRGAVGRSELWCKGDGERARRADDQGGYVDVPCWYKDCPIFREKKCKPLTRLLFLLPDVPGIGIWEIDTTSYFGSQNLTACVQMVRQLTRGRIAMIPLKLRVVPQTVSPDGKAKTVYVLDLKLEDIKIRELIHRLPTLELDAPIVEVSEEMPDDLYIEDNLVRDADIQAAKAPKEPLVVVDVAIKTYDRVRWGFLKLLDANGQTTTYCTHDAKHLSLLKRLEVGSRIEAVQGVPSTLRPEFIEMTQLEPWTATQSSAS
ncbi:hypothetical protein [Alicyclobacillus sp. SP_1]|uniref:recombination directionality factor n=1 Tax=Alicyclobacillus sp. SP_1 TaxID=2942475 RepID=UPI002157F8BB|nr:hypothetical protein [Alicyclobacillus sp. SP_1]